MSSYRRTMLTYKNPTAKIDANAIFCIFDIYSFQNRTLGKPQAMKSCMTLIILAERTALVAILANYAQGSITGVSLRQLAGAKILALMFKGPNGVHLVP
jgi:hypothetical protein